MVSEIIKKITEADSEVGNAISAELGRQKRGLELIASENLVSEAVMITMGTPLTNKYAEGYPAKRYYGGCECVDVVENIAIERACKLFGANYANVQPHSGAQANTAVYFALIKPGDTVLGMNLAHGGHLTHGSPVNISGNYYNFVPYGVNDNGFIDYDELERIAKENNPKLIVAGASAYPRAIDFERISKIAKEVGAYFMVDMAHIAGLVAAGEHASPVPYADVVTTTTHKTLRGPRGGLILTNDEEIAKCDCADAGKRCDRPGRSVYAPGAARQGKRQAAAGSAHRRARCTACARYPYPDGACAGQHRHGALSAGSHGCGAHGRMALRRIPARLCASGGEPTGTDGKGAHCAAA